MLKSPQNIPETKADPTVTPVNTRDHPGKFRGTSTPIVGKIILRLR